MNATPRDFKRLTDLVRRNFWLLAALAEQVHSDLKLTASGRAILEHLDDHGPSTVPQIAAEKAVKRQSIQELVDKLFTEQLVEFVPNPAHRRSRLVRLSATGKALFEKVRTRELELTRSFGTELGNDIAISMTIEVLDRLRTTLIEVTAAAANRPGPT